MVQINPGAHPSEERIGAFAERRLSPSDAAAVEAHLADCDVCRRLYADVCELLDEPIPVIVDEPVPAPSADDTVRQPEPSAPVAPWWKQRRFQLAAAGVLAAAASLTVVLVRPELSPFHRSTPYEELVAAVGPNRLIEGRLSGGFQYGPMRSATRSAPSGFSTSLQLLAAAARLEAEATGDASIENLRALGAAYLLLGKRDQAVKTLQRAAANGPDHAIVQSDLAAAYLERASKDDRAGDYASALEATDKAVRLAPDLIEAHYNRALALDALGLGKEAEAAWQEYLRRDPSSEWSAAVRRRLASGDRQHSSSQRQRGMPRPEELNAPSNRSSQRWETWDHLLSQAGTIDSDGSATPWLARLRNAGDELTRATGDRLPGDVAAHATSLGTSARRKLIGGITKFRAAVAAYDRDETGKSRPLFEHAFSELRGVGSPLAEWCRYYLAVLNYYDRRHRRAAAALEEVAALAEQRTHLLLNARARWLTGLLNSIEGRYGAAAQDYTEARALLTKVGELEGEAAVEGLLADVYTFLGEPHVAWQSLLRAMRTTIHTGAHRRRHTILKAGIRACLADQLLGAVMYFHNELTLNAMDWGQAGALVEASLGRAAARVALGDTAGGRRDLETARRELADVPDDVLRSRFQIQFDKVAAELEEQPSSAVERLSRVIDGDRRRGAIYDLADTLLRRARILFRVGATADAERDLADAVEVIRTQRNNVASASLRASLMSRAWDIVETLISHRYEQGNIREALALTDQMRAGDFSSPAVWPRLPNGVGLIYFIALPDSLLSFSACGDRPLFHHRTQLRSDRLAMYVDEVRAAIQAGRENDSRMLVELSRHLFDAHRATLECSRRLLIAPDGALAFLPFAALRDPVTSRPFVERVSVVLVPALVTLRPGAPVLSAADNALIVGIARVERPGNELAPLPGAEVEARRIAALYRHPKLLVGPAATKRQVVSLLRGAQVIHFGTHAVTNEQFPGLSRLLLSGDDGDLFGAELSAVSLRRQPVVVLGACESGSGRMLRGKGVMSLAQMFVSAGASSVVATLWEAEDHASAQLLERFHAYALDGLDSGDALRRAQLDEARESGSRTWAVYTAMSQRY